MEPVSFTHLRARFAARFPGSRGAPPPFTFQALATSVALHTFDRAQVARAVCQAAEAAARCFGLTTDAKGCADGVLSLARDLAFDFDIGVVISHAYATSLRDKYGTSRRVHEVLWNSGFGHKFKSLLREHKVSVTGEAEGPHSLDLTLITKCGTLLHLHLLPVRYPPHGARTIVGSLDAVGDEDGEAGVGVDADAGVVGAAGDDASGSLVAPLHSHAVLVLKAMSHWLRLPGVRGSDLEQAVWDFLRADESWRGGDTVADEGALLRVLHGVAARQVEVEAEAEVELEGGGRPSGTSVPRELWTTLAEVTDYCRSHEYIR